MALEDAKTQIDTAVTRDGFKGPSFENAFSGVSSFLRRTYSKDLSGVDLAITGVPFDQAVTNRPGTRLGPRAIREASALQAFDAPYGWGFDPMTYQDDWGLEDAIARYAIDGLDFRADNIDMLDEIELSSVDFYATVRSLYQQNRASEIVNGVTNIDDLPDIDDLDNF